MSRIEALRVIVAGFELMQRETMSREGAAEEDRERDEALRVLGATDEEIREAVWLETGR